MNETILYYQDYPCYNTHTTVDLLEVLPDGRLSTAVKHTRVAVKNGGRS